MSATHENQSNQELHDDTKRLAKVWLKSEKNLIAALIVVQEREAFRDFRCKGLFKYCQKHLDLTAPVAQMLRTMVNHALKYPELREALETEKIPVAYASRIVSSLTKDNVTEVLEFAEQHSLSETETWLYKEKGVSRKHTYKVETETHLVVKAVKEFVGGNPSDDDIIKRVFQDYYERNHPVEKAKRSKKQKAQSKTSTSTSASTSMSTSTSEAQTSANTPAKKSVVEEPVSKDSAAPVSPAVPEGKVAPPPAGKRRRLTNAQKHAMHDRDGLRCVFKDTNGHRCRETRWTQKHHIVQVAHGGGNEVSNLVTLCPEHHDLVHQLSFPLDEQRDWIPASQGLSPDQVSIFKMDN